MNRCVAPFSPCRCGIPPCRLHHQFHRTWSSDKCSRQGARQLGLWPPGMRLEGPCNAGLGWFAYRADTSKRSRPSSEGASWWSRGVFLPRLGDACPDLKQVGRVSLLVLLGYGGAHSSCRSPEEDCNPGPGDVGQVIVFTITHYRHWIRLREATCSEHQT